MANTTWNPSDKSANLTLSGGNLTATGTAGNSTGVRSASSKSAGKYYFEFTCTTWIATYVIVGVGNASAILVGAASTPTNISGVYGYNGSIWTNNVNTGSTLGTRADGDIIGCALDMTNALIWFRAAPSGNWNGSGTANPGTGAGGLSTSAIGGPLFAFAGSSSPAEVITANFGDSAFSGAIPSGFTAGLPGTQANLTQIAAEHWLSAQAQAQLTQVAVEQWASVGGSVPHTGNYTYGISGTRAGLSGMVLDQSTKTYAIAMPAVIGESGTPPPALPSGAQARVWVMA